MATALYDTERITKSDRKQLKNLLTLVVSNYGNDTAYITAKGIKRPIPPINNTVGVPVFPFRIESYGHGFDIDFTIDFPSGNGDVVIDYLKINEC